jgi:hypothetical protein
VRSLPARGTGFQSGRSRWALNRRPRSGIVSAGNHSGSPFRRFDSAGQPGQTNSHIIAARPSSPGRASGRKSESMSVSVCAIAEGPNGETRELHRCPGRYRGHAGVGGATLRGNPAADQRSARGPGFTYLGDQSRGPESQARDRSRRVVTELALRKGSQKSRERGRLLGRDRCRYFKNGILGGGP